MIVDGRAIKQMFAGILGQETPVETPATVVTPVTLVTPTPTPTPVPEPTPVIKFETPTGLTDWKMMIEQAAMTVLARHYGRTYADPPVAVPAAKWGQMLAEMWQEAKRTGTAQAYAEAERRWRVTRGDIYFLTRGFYMQGTYPRIETPGGVWQPAGPEPTPAVVTPAPVVTPEERVAPRPSRDPGAGATGIWNSIFDRVLYQVTGRSTMLKAGQTIVRAGEGMELTAAQFRQIVAAVQAAVQDVAADPQRPADLIALLQRSATEGQISAKLLSRAFYAPGVLPPVVTPPEGEAKYTYEKVWGRVVWMDKGNPQSVASQALNVVIEGFVAQTGVQLVPYAKGYDTMVLPVTWDQGMDLCKAAKELVLEARRARTIGQTIYIRSLSFLRNPRERIEFRIIHPDVPTPTPTVAPPPTPGEEGYSIEDAVGTMLRQERYATMRTRPAAMSEFDQLVLLAEKEVDPAIRSAMTRPDLLTALATELMRRGYGPMPRATLTLPYAAPITWPGAAVTPTTPILTPTPTPTPIPTPTPGPIPIPTPTPTPTPIPTTQAAAWAGIQVGLRTVSRDALTPTRVGDRVRWYIPGTEFDALVSTSATAARDWYAAQGGDRDAYPLEEWRRVVTIELTKRGYFPRAAPTPTPTPATPAPVMPVPAPPAPGRRQPLTSAHLLHEACENILAQYGLASGYAGPYYLPAPKWRELRADIHWESTRLSKLPKYHQPQAGIWGGLSLSSSAVDAELRRRNILPASPVVVTPPSPTPVAPVRQTLEEWAAEAPIFRDFSECSAAARKATGRTPDRYMHCLTEADIRHSAVSQALAAEGMSIDAYRRGVTQEQYNRLVDTANNLAAAMISQRTYTPFYLGRRWALLL